MECGDYNSSRNLWPWEGTLSQP